jgi:hypothetical protein
MAHVKIDSGWSIHRDIKDRDALEQSGLSRVRVWRARRRKEKGEMGEKEKCLSIAADEQSVFRYGQRGMETAII